MPGSPVRSSQVQEYFQKRVGGILPAADSAWVLPSLHLEDVNKDVHCAEEFERERSELLQRVESCSTQRAELHQLEWQNRRRADEICELQKVTRTCQSRSGHCMIAILL